jgi:hypothetical protein
MGVGSREPGREVFRREIERGIAHAVWTILALA